MDMVKTFQTVGELTHFMYDKMGVPMAIVSTVSDGCTQLIINGDTVFVYDRLFVLQHQFVWRGYILDSRDSDEVDTYETNTVLLYKGDKASCSSRLVHKGHNAVVSRFWVIDGVVHVGLLFYMREDSPMLVWCNVCDVEPHE